jgi:hypothetical protein
MTDEIDRQTHPKDSESRWNPWMLAGHRLYSTLAFEVFSPIPSFDHIIEEFQMGSARFAVTQGNEVRAVFSFPSNSCNLGKQRYA